MDMKHNFVVGRIPNGRRSVSGWPKLPEKKEHSYCSAPVRFVADYKVCEDLNVSGKKD